MNKQLLVALALQSAGLLGRFQIVDDKPFGMPLYAGRMRSGSLGRRQRPPARKWQKGRTYNGHGKRYYDRRSA